MFSPTKTLFIILCIALALRLFYFVELMDNPMPQFMAQGVDFDQYNFITLAREIREKGWMGESFAGFSPTYGYFLAAIFALFGEHINAVFLIQLLFGVFNVFMFYKTARLIFDSERIGIAAALMACLYAPFIYYEGSILRAGLIPGINLLSFYLLALAEKRKDNRFYSLGGFCVGLSVALRPNLIPCFIVLYFLFLLPRTFRQKSKILTLFIIGFLIAVAPISLRNKAIGHDVGIAKPGPTIFWLGNSYDTAGVGLTRTATQQQLAEESGHDVVKTLQIFIREINKYPEDYAALYWRKFKMFFNDYEIPGNMNFYLFKENSIALRLAFLNFGIVCALGLLGMAVLLKHGKQNSLLFTYIIGLSFFVLIFHIQSRYRMPVMPFFILFAAYGIDFLYQTFSSKKFRVLSIAFVGLAMLTFFTISDNGIIDKYLHGRIGYISYSNWSFAYAGKAKNYLEKAGQTDDTSLKKALALRNQSINTSDGKNRDTLILHRVYIFLDMHRYEEALTDLKYLTQKYPNSVEVIKTQEDLERFIETIPPEARRAPVI